MDPYTLTAEGRFFVTEDALGGNILDFVLLSSTKGYAITQDAALHNHLVSFDPSAGTLLRDLLDRDAYLPDIIARARRPPLARRSEPAHARIAAVRSGQRPAAPAPASSTSGCRPSP